MQPCKGPRQPCGLHFDGQSKSELKQISAVKHMSYTSSCQCDAIGYLHAHCYCFLCNCKALSCSTYQYQKAAEELQTLNSSDLQELTCSDDSEHNEGASSTSECNSDPGRRFICIYSCWMNYHFCGLLVLKKFELTHFRYNFLTLV